MAAHSSTLDFAPRPAAPGATPAQGLSWWRYGLRILSISKISARTREVMSTWDMDPPIVHLPFDHARLVALYPVT
jgi:hypothetical protein